MTHTNEDPTMSINSFPIDSGLAQRVQSVLSRQTPDSKFDIVATQGTPGLCYIREIRVDGSTEMHGRECNKHVNVMRSHSLREAAKKRAAQAERLAARNSHAAGGIGA